MSWTDDIKEIERQRRMAEEMGGADSVAFQHGRGKLTVRERIELLADPGSFHEIGVLAGTATWEDGSVAGLTPSNMVVGTVRVDGRKVAFSGGDFTIRGGASDANIGNKSRFAEEFALRGRLPFVRLLDATGGSVKTFEQIGRTYLPGGAGTDVSAQLLQTVPVVSAVLGSVAGLPAVQACLCHFNVMVKGTSQVFVAGPKVVEQATGQRITKEELGDERTQVKNGVVMNLAEDEADAIGQVRRFLSYLPSSVWEAPPEQTPDDDPERRAESLLSAVPQDRRRTYDPHEIVGAVVDEGSFFEIGPYYGRARVTGLARVDGMPCGVMSNDPRFNGGSMNIAAGEKIAPPPGTLRDLPSTARLLRRRARVLGRPRAGALRDSKGGRPRRDGAQLDPNALHLLRRAAALRSRRRTPLARPGPLPPLCLALGARRLDAHPGWHRDRLQARDRGRRGPGGEAGRD